MEERGNWFSLEMARLLRDDADLVFDEMSKAAGQNPHLLLALDEAQLAFHKSLLQMAQEEAAKRGAKQIDRDLGEGGSGQDED